MNGKEVIPLFYWSEIEFIHKTKENYGDLLSKYIVEKISGKTVIWIQPKKTRWYHFNKSNYLVIGSIIHHANKHSIVWGSGIIDNEQSVTSANYKAVRGPQTRKFLLKNGYSCPEVYGDPAILLPKYFNPEVIKHYALGIIPHYHDYEQVREMYKNHEDVLVVDLMTLDVEDVTRQILSCKKTISSSLHGVIVSHTYNIPSIWVKFSNKIFGDDIKYIDYLESVNLDVYEPRYISRKESVEELLNLIQTSDNLPSKEQIKNLQNGLVDSCPF